MCALIHGSAAADEAAAASKGFTSAADSLSPEQLSWRSTGEIPTTRTEIAGRDAIDLLVETGLAASKGEARRLIAGGGIYVNDVALAREPARSTADDLLHGRYVMLRKGKRQRHLLVSG